MLVASQQPAKQVLEQLNFCFPYEFRAVELANRLAKENLHQVLFNLPPGNWDAGKRGIAALPGRQVEFLESIE